MTWPASALAQARDSTLVMLDMQTRSVATLPRADAAGVMRTAARLLRAAAALSIPLIYTEHDEPSHGNLDPRLRDTLPSSAYRVRKKAFCAWNDDAFANALDIAGRRQIVISGLQAHVGVLQTAVRLLEHDYAVFVVEDGVGSHDPALKTNALQRLHAESVHVVSCESLLHEWFEDSEPTARDTLLTILHET